MTNFVIFPRYEDIYDGVRPDLLEVLKGIPTCIIVGFACHINSMKHPDPFNPHVDIEVFRLMIVRLGADKANTVEARMKNFHINIEPGQQFIIFPLPQMLSLIEYAIANYQEGPFDQIAPEQEENILKAVLILNSIADVKSIPKKLSQRSKDPLENFISITWPFMLPTIEHTYRKEIIIPIHLSLLLLEFLNTDTYFQPYLQKYLETNNLDTPEEYVKNLMGLYIFSYNKGNNVFGSNFTEEDMMKVPLLGQFTRTIDRTAKDIFAQRVGFYKLIREKPILKITDGKYFVCNWAYIMDKLYEGLKYDFFEHSGIKDSLKGTNDNEKFGTFMSRLGQDFSEKAILKDLATRYFNRNNAILAFEDRSKGWNQDLYHRKDNHITFIEYKNVTMPLSDSFAEIKANVDGRMIGVKDSSGKILQKKAAYQLIDQIKDFHENINKFEDIESIGYTKERLCIYPMIIFTDLNWRLAGVYEYISKIFRKELSGLALKFFAVKDIIMVHVDFLYTYENIFLKDNFNLHQFICQVLQVKETYSIIANRANGRSPQAIVDAFSDFEFFAHNAFRNKAVHSHEMTLFKEIIAKLNLPE